MFIIFCIFLTITFVDSCIPTQNIEFEPITTTSTSTTTSSTTTSSPTWHCLDDTWTLFDRGTYHWCIKPVYGAVEVGNGASLCINSVLTGFQNANELDTMSDVVVAYDSSIDDMAVGAKRSANCRTKASLSTSSCTASNMFYWTDNITTGSDGFIWYPNTPNGCVNDANCADGMYVLLYVQHKELDDYPYTFVVSGSFCGVLAESS